MEVAMKVFAAFSIPNPDAVKNKLEKEYPNDFREIGEGVFFIATRGETTRQVADRIGLGLPAVSSGIVVPIVSYWGNHAGETWEWIEAKRGVDGE